jgi:glycosyltransferase involved in cell wall biosynthesis
MNNPSVSIVIPAYNESTRIRPLLSEISELCELREPDSPAIEFIFVCDGTDNTADIIRDYKKNNQDLMIRCLDFPRRLGKGGGVKAGFAVASTPLVGFMDADNSASVSEMVRISHLIGEHDGVIGSRHLPGQVLQRKQPLLRRVQSRIFNGIIRLLFGLSFYDTQCGAKVFRKDALDAVLPGLRSTGFEFDVELLWHLSKSGYSLIEVPVIWNDTLDSRLRLSDTFSMLASLFRIRLGD